MSLGSLRQTAVELLACALCDLFPKTQLIENRVSDIGFMCAVVLPQRIGEDAFPLIEERMHAIVRENPAIRMMEMVPSNAADFLLHHKQPIKAAQMEDVMDGLVSLIQFKGFVDTCALPPLNNFREIKAFKLQKMEVRNEGTEQISYFYGTAFFEKAELKQFLKRAETAHQRDHKLIGQEMQLYMPLQATGLWLWKPRGMEFKELLRTVEAKQWKSKTVQHIGLPFIIPANHDDQGNVFIDGRPYSVDFDASEMRQGLLQVCQQSTEQLPLHYVYRRRIYSFLANSQLEGLLESRNGEIDEVYSFCTQDQLIEELTSSLQIIEKAISLFPIEFEWTLYTQCPTGFKNRKAWKEAVELLQGILERQDLKYTLDKEKPSQSGPQLEVSIADAFGRRWVGPYIRIDIPNSPNSKPNLAMFSQSLWGPIERFIALLIESTGGDLPFWLAPEQVRIIPVSKEYFDDALTMSNMIQSAGARSNIDKRQAVLGEKVYAAKCERVPYVIIIGEREKQRDMVSVRSRSTEECKMTVQVFMEQLRKLLKEDEQNKRSFS